jgi:hypothetical protein
MNSFDEVDKMLTENKVKARMPGIKRWIISILKYSTRFKNKAARM